MHDTCTEGRLDIHENIKGQGFLGEKKERGLTGHKKMQKLMRPGDSCETFFSRSAKYWSTYVQYNVHTLVAWTQTTLGHRTLDVLTERATFFFIQMMRNFSDGYLSWSKCRWQKNQGKTRV